HQKAGSRLVLEMHGHLLTATCLNCGQVVPTDRLWEPYLIDRQMPRCASCGGVLKPDVVLFGEPVPYEPLAQAQEDALRCDVMLVIGSSLEIMPAADLPFLARRHGAHVIVVNYQPTAVDKLADVVFHEDVIAVLPQLVETCRADLS
ncbi:MAG TPA: NAD-dependent protein deacylase, partial [Anaerolineae bacterium]|nr:NAD-dependent protein deacylase [Anaerolineae bacterium]